MIVAHTTRRADWKPHNGACFLANDRASYGEFRYEYELPSELLIEEVQITREQIDENEWPGDTARERAAYASQGIDVIVYDDMDESGRSHTTYRIVSDRAVLGLIAVKI